MIRLRGERAERRIELGTAISPPPDGPPPKWSTRRTPKGNGDTKVASRCCFISRCGGERGERRKAMETRVAWCIWGRSGLVVNALNAERQWRSVQHVHEIFKDQAVVNAENAERQWKHFAGSEKVRG